MLGLYQTLTSEQKKELAQAAGTTVEYLSHIAHGHRRASSALTLSLVRVTGGRVTPHELRPDLYPDPDWLPAEARSAETAS